MHNSFRFFENRDCRYFPCHRGLKELNCLFCYCPFYLQEDCPGTPEVIRTKEGYEIRNCTNCVWPHKPENYPEIIKKLSEACRKGGKQGAGRQTENGNTDGSKELT